MARGLIWGVLCIQLCGLQLKNSVVLSNPTYQQRLTCTSLFWFGREDSLSKGSLTLFALCNLADIEPISLKSRQTNIHVTTLSANDPDEGKDGEVEFSILEGNVLVTTLFISFEIHFKYWKTFECKPEHDVLIRCSCFLFRTCSR